MPNFLDDLTPEQRAQHAEGFAELKREAQLQVEELASKRIQFEAGLPRFCKIGLKSGYPNSRRMQSAQTQSAQTQSAQTQSAQISQ